MTIPVTIVNDDGDSIQIVRRDGCNDIEIVVTIRDEVNGEDASVSSTFTITELERLQNPWVLNLGLDRSKL